MFIQRFSDNFTELQGGKYKNTFFTVENVKKRKVSIFAQAVQK
jgi:hypothetical protein